MLKYLHGYYGRLVAALICAAGVAGTTATYAWLMQPVLDDLFIAKMAVHRMEASPDGVTFVEVQRGKCDEEDIVRLQDDYGRVAKQP